MRYFYYQCILDTGERKTSVEKLSFDNMLAAQVYLEKRWQATVISIKMLPFWLTPIIGFIAKFRVNPISREELTDFLHNLSVMQRSGIPAFDAISELTSSDNSPAIRKLATDMMGHLQSGLSLSEAFKRHDDIIPDTVIHLTQIGEHSGNLDQTLLDASKHLHRVSRIISDSKKAMIYPTFVFIAIIGATAFWMGYVIPSLSGLFKQMQVELPPLTIWLLEMSDNFVENLMWVVGIFVTVVVISILLIKKVQKVRYGFHYILLKLPVIKVLNRASALAFITEYMSLMVASGVTILDSLTVLVDSTKNEVYKKTIFEMREGLKLGNSLSSEMRKTGYYPGFVTRMISVGEQSGRLEEQLTFLAEEYRNRFDDLVSNISEIIKPLVMFFAGGLFIIMIVGLFLPIFDLIGAAGG